MDWEKQDNELRKLVDGADFLPDGERFDSAASWKKMQEKNRPSQKKIFAPWMRMAVAACIVGLLGLLVWRVQIQNDFTPADPVVKNNKKTTKNVPPIQSTQQASATDTNQHTTASTENKTFTSPSFRIPASKQKETEPPVIGTVEKNMAQHDVLITEGQKNIPVIIPDNHTQPANATASALPIDMPNTAATAAPKKPTLRVVHYNDLKGNFSTPPPVFVQTKKSDNEWQQLVLQNAASSREHPLSIKIDINPAPKKSL